MTRLGWKKFVDSWLPTSEEKKSRWIRLLWTWTMPPPFFRAAWEACLTIPRGETRSYAWVAAAAGSPGAFRAAGQAMARNRLAVVVPCHRVIGSDGGLHGYGGGGLDKKAKLLNMERTT